MTLTDYFKKWLPRMKSSEREEFISDTKGMLDPPENTIWVETVISGRDTRPIVGVRIGPYAFQVSPEDARKIGRDFYEVAGGAENDAFLFQTLTTKLELPPQVAFALINELREWRTSRINQPLESLKVQ
jgi:hypothetical protein